MKQAKVVLEYREHRLHKLSALEWKLKHAAFMLKKPKQKGEANEDPEVLLCRKRN